MFFLCNSLPKVLGHLTFISKGTPGCAEDCCFTACLILPCRSPVDVAQFPLLAAADSQHPSHPPPPPPSLPWQKLRSALTPPPPGRPPLRRISWVTGHPSPRLASPPSPCPTPPPRCIQLLKNNRCSRVCRGRAVWWELCPSWLLTVIGAPGLTPTDPSPHLWTPAPLCLLSRSLSTCLIWGLLLFKASLQCPSRWPSNSLISTKRCLCLFELRLYLTSWVSAHINICSHCDVLSMFGWAQSRLAGTWSDIKKEQPSLHCCGFKEMSDKYWHL